MFAIPSAMAIYLVYLNIYFKCVVDYKGIKMPT